MRYNQNYKFRNNQQKDSMSLRQQRRKEDKEYAGLASQVIDKFWWTSLVPTQKQKVMDNYLFCLTNFDGSNGKFWWYGGPGIDLIADVSTPESYLEWENEIKELIGSPKKIRDQKLKSLGIKF